MILQNSYELSLLDRIRVSHGIDKLKNTFRKVLDFNPSAAFELINQDRLNFFTLYLLFNEINEYGIFTHLNSRNQKAIIFINHISLNNTRIVFDDSFYIPLKWILTTGHFNDGFSNEYDEILEKSVIILIKIFKDSSDFKLIINMLFERYKRGFNIHDLTWAIFESTDRRSLFYIAEHLRSNDEKDLELANKLLNFVPKDSYNRSDNGKLSYSTTVDWLNRNSIRLKYTGESFQQSSNPKSFKV